MARSRLDSRMLARDTAESPQMEAPLLEVKDEHDNNPSVGPRGVQVSVSLHHEDGNEIVGALEGSTTCAVDDLTGKARFRNSIRLREGAGGDSSTDFYLRFALGGIDGVEVKSEPIHFTPHEHIVEQTQAADAMTSELKDNLKAATMKLKTLKKRLETEKEQVQKIIPLVDAQRKHAAEMLRSASIEYSLYRDVEDLGDIAQVLQVLDR